METVVEGQSRGSGASRVDRLTMFCSEAERNVRAGVGPIFNA